MRKKYALSGIILICSIFGMGQPSLAQTPISQIVFASNRSGDYELYLVNDDGSNLIRLTDNPANDSDPDWSPDGNQLLFLSDRDGEDQVYIMEAQGTNLRQLTSDASKKEAPAWSPKGNLIAYVAYDRDLRQRDIFVIHSEGGSPVRLTESHQLPEFHWSPDGQQIAFSTERQISIITLNMENLAESTTWQLADDIPDLEGFALDWSPDGKQLAFHNSIYERTGISIIDLETLQVRDLESACGSSPQWSPDGRLIAFENCTQPLFALVDVEADREIGLLYQIVDEIKWASSGEQLVFIISRQGGFGSVLYAINADGSNMRVLADTPLWNYQPDWHPVRDNTVPIDLAAIPTPSPAPIVPTSTPLPATLPPPELIQLGSSAQDLRQTTQQAQAGETIQVYPMVIECCYMTIPVDVPVTWSVEPAEYASIDEAGVLTIGDDAPHGTQLIVSADLGTGQNLTTTIYVYRAAENPLVGSWTQIAITLCDSETEVAPNDSLGELTFEASGKFSVTWFPFEVYFDYAGAYQFQLSTGELSLVGLRQINYLPPTIDGSGTFSFNEDGDLILKELDLGEPPNNRADFPLICEQRFTQDYARWREERERLSSQPANVFGQVRWNGEPVQGIVVNLLSDDTYNACFGTEFNYEAESITDENGSYHFDDVPPGNYVLAFNSWRDTEKADDGFGINCSGRQFIIFAGQQREENRDLVKQDLQVDQIENGAAETPTFSWEAYPGAVYYKLSLFRHDPSYEATMYELRTSETSLISTVILGQGMSYSGWVYAYNEHDVPIASGDIADFRVRQ